MTKLFLVEDAVQTPKGFIIHLEDGTGSGYYKQLNGERKWYKPWTWIPLYMERTKEDFEKFIGDKNADSNTRLD